MGLAGGGCSPVPPCLKSALMATHYTRPPPDAQPLTHPQALALFNKAMRKLHSHLRAAKEAAIARHLPKPSAAPALAAAGGLGGGADLDAELDEAGEEVARKLRAQFEPAELAQYAVTGARRLWGAGRGAGAWVCLRIRLAWSGCVLLHIYAVCYMLCKRALSTGALSRSPARHPCCWRAGADEDFARALGGAAPGSGGIVQIKGGGGGNKGSGGGSGSGGDSPGASLYKKQGGKKQKGGAPGGGKPAKKHRKG